MLHHVASHANFEDVEASLMNQEHSGDVLSVIKIASCLLERECYSSVSVPSHKLDLCLNSGV